MNKQYKNYLKIVKDMKIPTDEQAERSSLQYAQKVDSYTD